jgi:hypothetical protein
VGLSIDELQSRLKRIFAALGDTLVVDFADYKPQIADGEKFVFLLHEIRTRPTKEDVHNAVFSAIANVGSLKDNLKKWATRNGRDPARVEEFVRSSFDLQVILDLWNGDKHGYPLRFSHSGREPRLTDLRTVLSLSTGTTPHSSAGVVLGPAGPQIELTRSGGGGLAITGSVVDMGGLHLGDVEDFLRRAVEAWRTLLTEYGVQVPASG